MEVAVIGGILVGYGAVANAAHSDFLGQTFDKEVKCEDRDFRILQIRMPDEYETHYSPPMYANPFNKSEISVSVPIGGGTYKTRIRREVVIIDAINIQKHERDDYEGPYIIDYSYWEDIQIRDKAQTYSINNARAFASKFRNLGISPATAGIDRFPIDVIEFQVPRIFRIKNPKAPGYLWSASKETLRFSYRWRNRLPFGISAAVIGGAMMASTFY